MSAHIRRDILFSRSSHGQFSKPLSETIILFPTSNSPLLPATTWWLSAEDRPDLNVYFKYDARARTVLMEVIAARGRVRRAFSVSREPLFTGSKRATSSPPF